MNIIKYLQIGNALSTTYNASAATDSTTKGTFIGGISATAVVAAVLAAIKAAGYPLTDELIATVMAIAGAGLTQVIPWLTNWLEGRRLERDAKKKAEAEARLAVSPITAALHRPDPPVTPVTVVSEDTEITHWRRSAGVVHEASLSLCHTIAQARTQGATDVQLLSQEWIKIA